MRILIVGAGIAGLLMYRELKNQGFVVDLVEKKNHLNVQGAGICLPGNALHWFAALGLKGAILDKAYQVHEIRYENQHRALLSKATLDQGVLKSQPFVALPRAELLNILADGVRSDIQFGRAIVEIISDGKTESVLFNDGRVTDYDLVIGADGLHSNVREQCFSSPQLLDLNVIHWRFTVDMPTANLAPSYLIGKTDAFMFYPIGIDKVYCYGQVTANALTETFYSDEKKKLLAIFDDYHDSVKFAIDRAQHIVKGRLKSVVSREIYNSRAVLIGDALHGCPPSLQQGVAQALEDVMALSKSLKVHSDIDIALDDFKKKRLKQVSWVIDESNKVIALAQLGQSKFGRLVRNTLIKLQGPQNVKAWRKLMTEQGNT